MNFEQALTLIEEQAIVHVVVETFNKDRVLTVSEETPPQVAEKLRGYKDFISPLSKVIFVAATKSQRDANLKGAAKWQVMTNDLPIVSHTGTPTHTGYISPKENDLQMQLLKLQNDVALNKRIDELEKKYEGKKGNEMGDWMKMLPLLGLVLEIKPDKLQAINALSGLVNGMNGNIQQPAINGISGPENNNNGATVEMTEAEEKQWDAVDEGIVELSKKVPVEKIQMFLDTLNKKPEFLDTLITLSQTHK
jgi:hypothetical protein